MRKILLLCYLLIYSLLINANDQQDLDQIRNLIATDLESSKDLALSLREESINNSNQEVLFRVNYLLGYIYKEEGDFGKAIIFYLEAIRYIEKSGSKELDSDLSSLYNRCAIIFKKFKAYELAKSYYYKALSLSTQYADTSSLILINYNLAGLLIDESDYVGAVSILKNYLDLISEDSEKYFDYHNRMATAYYESGRYEKALKAYQKLELHFEDYNAKERGYIYHNKALSYYKLNDFSNAENNFHNAIREKKQYSDEKILVSSYMDYAKLLYEVGNSQLAFDYLKKGEEILSIDNSRTPEYFEIHKMLANVHFELNNFQEAKKYEDLYSENLNAYLKLQEEIQETDKRYNMDLITKRYFDEVEKQERIASILFYSKLISGSLLMLLLLSVGFNWYQKTKLRRSIVRELIDLKILD